MNQNDSLIDFCKVGIICVDYWIELASQHAVGSCGLA